MSKQQIRQLKDKARKISFSEACSNKTDNEIAGNIRIASDGFTYTLAWRELLSRVLDEYGCRCMKCGVLPKHSRCVNVDHIKPRRFFPELALDEDNLQVLCRICNKHKGNGPAVDYRPAS